MSSMFVLRIKFEFYKIIFIIVAWLWRMLVKIDMLLKSRMKYSIRMDIFDALYKFLRSVLDKAKSINDQILLLERR